MSGQSHKMINDQLYREVRRTKRLKDAWDHIYSNGTHPDKSRTTRAAVQKYKENEIQNLRALQDKLRKEKFVFQKALAFTPKKKKGLGVRPLVVTDINTRIIQRCLLSILQEQEFIKPFLRMPTSFGGISKQVRPKEKLGVEGAIIKLLNAINVGAQYFIKSDIRDFFTSIPLPTIYAFIEQHISDKKFLDLLKRATNLEIENIGSIETQYRDLFDFNLKGTPQGCCLSSLFGNILLHEFDILTNASGATCLRFLDDFIIVAPSAKSAWASYKKGEKAAQKHKLKMYDPKKDMEKAREGAITQRLEFLGVEIENGRTRPSNKNITNLLQNIDELLKASAVLNPDKASEDCYDLSYVRTLSRISNKIQGWGNQYKFCNERSVFDRVDIQINRRIEAFYESYQKQRRLLKDNSKASRRLLGVYLLTDCKNDGYTLDNNPHETRSDVDHISICNTIYA